MSFPVQHKKRNKIDKKFLSKNKTIKLYKEKKSKIDLYQKEVTRLTQQYEQVDFVQLQRFDHFPLSERTRRGLKAANYVSPTDIQRETIGLALKGHDILGAAQTGSGKTLAFIIPLLERLFCAGWSILDGLGALIITPTRELAYQIFEVLNKVGANHHFSVALVIGGKDLAKEKKLLDKCNILICTPGRLLQHMDQNPLFDAMNLKLLVLDEADRILDLGFERTVNAILDNLPVERQTLLFSATQTKSVKDLARLSLKNPVYVSVHEYSKHTTPEALQQSYLVCDAHDKMNMIWSFIKNHKKQKILVFVASCKQAKYIYESLCRLKPGVTLMALYGSLHQLRRMQIYDEFCKKNYAVMFATDVASRGLDFPNVNWVVQLDCPEDVNTYIHRAGRTARYEKGGASLLILLPSEKESMVEQLLQRKVPIEELRVNPSKLVQIQNKLDLLVSRDVNLKETCQRAFKAYLKNIFLMKDKTVFDVTKIDFELYAKSLGLKVTPRIRFLEKKLKSLKEEISCSEKSLNKADTLTPQKCNDEDIASNILITVNESGDSDQDIDEEEILKTEESKLSKKPLTKAAVAKKLLKKNVKPNTITKFDDDDKPIRVLGNKTIPVVADEILKQIVEEGFNLKFAQLIKEEESKIDKMLFKEKVKSKHKGAKLKLKAKRLENRPNNAPAVLNDSEENSQNNDGVNFDHEDYVSESDVDPNMMSESEGEDEELISSPLMTNDATQVDSENYSSEEYSPNTSHLGNKRKKNSKNTKSKKQRTFVYEPEDMAKAERSIEDDEQLASLLLSNT